MDVSLLSLLDKKRQIIKIQDILSECVHHPLLSVIFWVCDMDVLQLLHSGKLAHVLPNYPLEEITAYLFYRYSEYEQRKVRCFIDFFTDKLKQ